ncbi:MAG: Uma2 family endonuclease [Fimbriimonadaceae bacterium]|nr:Uma2 family endonuclease [Fimbriimonadaceae bacterium]
MAIGTGVTVEEFAQLPSDLRAELVAGEIVTMPPAGYDHGALNGELAMALGAVIRQHRLGQLLTSETGFRLADATVRCPDLAFVSAQRVPPASRRGFAEVVPDLVVEVVSPSDPRAAAVDRALLWLTAGCRVVWLVWPASRSVDVYRAADDVSSLSGSDALTCPDLLPGFALPLTELFGVLD